MWSGINLNNTEAATLEIVATVTGDAAVTNNASISAVDQPDKNPSNDSASAIVTGQQADLMVTKSVDNPTPNVGTNVTFTIRVINNGPSTATAVVVNDKLPIGLGFISATPSTAYDSTSGDWTVGTLANGASATLTIVAVVNASTGITNIAQIMSSGLPDPNSTNNTGSSSLNGQQADLVLSKTASTATPNVGDNVSFTIIVQNNGPSTATNVVVTDLLPAGLSFVSANPAAAYSSSTGIWTVGTLANAANATLTLVAKVDQVGGITNSATAISNQPDPSSTNNTATATVTGQQADLIVTKTVNNAIPNIGTDVTFTIVVQNNGPSTATNVVVTDLLPAGLSFVSANPAAAYSSSTGVWTVGTLANAANATLTLVAKVDQAGFITNTASASSNQPDPDPLNSSSTATLTGQQADVSIHKTVDQPATNVGSNVTFTLMVTNNGPSEAKNVLVGDTLPAGLVYVSSIVGQGSYNASTGSWDVGTLASTANATLTIVARVTQVGNVVNTATVTSAQPDPNTNNNSSSVTVTGQEADLELTKVVNNAIPNVGSDVSFTLTIKNNGLYPVMNVTVRDELPAGLSFVSANPSVDYISNTGVWNVGTLAAGASTSLTIVAMVTQPGLIENSADITGSSLPDPDTTNNSATATVTGQQSDLAIAKSVSKANPILNEEITYTIQVTNNGPSTANNVEVRELLASGLEYVSDDSLGDYNPTTGLWTIGTLANGVQATLNIVVIVRQVDPPVTNTASITNSDTPDPNDGNNSSSVTIPSASADLVIEKSVNNSVPNVDTEVTFTVTVSNNGPDTATNIRINDILPAGLSYVSSSPSQGNYDNTTGLWDIGSVLLNEQASISIVALVIEAGVPITNTVQLISLDQVDTNPSNNRATATVTGQQADLSVLKGVDKPSVNVGENVIFTITVRNDGPSMATGVELTDVLPGGLTLVSASSNPVATYAGGVWSIGSLANGAEATLIIEAMVTQVGSITNKANITASDQPDPNTANNTDSVDVTGLAADLVLEKGVSSPTANVGSDVSFTITVRNTGPNDASNVIVTDLLPAGLSFVSATTAQGSYNNGSGAWTIGTLAVNDVVVLQIVATVTQSTSITNTAVVSSDTPDLDLTNNSRSATVSGLLADIQVVKIVNNARPNVGSNVSFSITVTNRGPGDASGIEILDALPAGLTFVSATPDIGSYTSSTGIWQLGSLANGASTSLTIVAQVTQASAIINTASVTKSIPADPTSSNNTSSANVTGQEADLVLTKQASSTSAMVGTNVSYTITLTNNGPSDASGVIVTDQWPAGLAFVSATASQGSFNSSTYVWDVGTVTNGANATLTIIAQVMQAIPITNSAQVSAADQPDPNSIPGNNSSIENDQAQVDIIGRPTAIHLSRFTASTGTNGVLLAWETSLEVNTWGFQIYRSASGERADAVLITDRLILARGRSQAGSQYTWLDQTAVPGQAYSYWLLEVETDGTPAEYGPASTARPAQDREYSIVLPLVVK